MLKKVKIGVLAWLGMLLGMSLLLSGCGGSAGGTAVPTITITLSDNNGVAVSSISSGAPATARAQVFNASGTPVPGVVVTFSTDPTLATIAPLSATALTDTNGIATVALSALNADTVGATALTATATVDTLATTGTISYSVGLTNLAISTPTFGIGGELSAFGTTSVAVTVTSGGNPITTPQTVNFTSPCASSGKAVLTASVVTVNGVATASYRDNGCANTDIITATVNSGIASSTASILVKAPSTGSIQFVSATPNNIVLRGMGGVANQESSQVVFKVVDTNGNPIGGKQVNFALSTTAGGIALTTTSAVSDPTTGQVVVGVNSGTVSTPVRVTASTCTTSNSPCTGTLLTTQSDQLTITTGIPDQHNTSLSVTTLNIEGWNMDGTTTTLTARLADHFGNPVPDGTVVNFTTEGSKIESSCTTGAAVGAAVAERGACSVVFSSQALRPSNGRVTVLAYAVGEEGFTDLNGNGMADNYASPSEMIDANGRSTDMGEAYVDYNEDGLRDSTKEPYIDFNANGAYDGPDGVYNGVLCDSNVALGSSAVACSAQKSLHVRQSTVVVLSGSNAMITINNGSQIGLPACNDGSTFSPPGAGSPGGPLTFYVRVLDVNGNAMPAGTTVDFKSDNGVMTSAATYTVPNTNGCRLGITGCPASAGTVSFGDIPVTMKSDSTYTAGTPATATAAATAATCTNTNPAGTFEVTVTTPAGMVTTASKTIYD